MPERDQSDVSEDFIGRNLPPTCLGLPVHPYLFRHQMLTHLTAKGRSDAQIQLISGHESKKSLEVYQHLSLEAADKAYETAVQTVGICARRPTNQFRTNIPCGPATSRL